MSERKQHRHAESCGAESMEIPVEKEMEDKVDEAMKVEPDDIKSKQEDIRDEPEDSRRELEDIKKELEEKTKLCADYFDKLQRTAAEFDNFKKRSLKEKEALYADAVCDVVSAFLPVLDNVERALAAISEDSSAQALKDGVDMVFKQFKDAMKSIGVEEIAALNEQFDPAIHNAVMHVEDEAFGSNTVVEEFQKGYIYKDRVIRYSMVKVAN